MRSMMFLLAVLWVASTGNLLAGGGGGQGLTLLPDRPVAPAFDLAGLDGKRIALKDFRGKPVIVNFWATWCPPCRAEMPSIQRAWEAVKDDGIAVIAVNVGEDAEIVAQFKAEYPLEFPLAMDKDFSAVQSWPVKGLPTTFVLDPEGRLAYEATGSREWDDPKLLDLVRALKSDGQSAGH
jgi:peroxiredoxin